MMLNNILTDFRYFFVSGLRPFLENAPAPKDITMKKSKTKTSIATKIPNFPSI